MTKSEHDQHIVQLALGGLQAILLVLSNNHTDGQHTCCANRLRIVRRKSTVYRQACSEHHTYSDLT